MARVPSSAPGHDVQIADPAEGQRILPHAIVQKLMVGLDGKMEPLTAGSTHTAALTVTHAGIVKVERFSFSL